MGITGAVQYENYEENKRKHMKTHYSVRLYLLCSKSWGDTNKTTQFIRLIY